MKIISMSILLIFLGGCAGQRIALQNEAGEVVKCEVSTGSAMLTGTLMRDRKMRRCVEGYESKGYTKVVEAIQEF